MKKSRNYDEQTVVEQLNEKHDLKINPYQKTIQELKRFPGPEGTPAKGDVGIKSRGKIHFLTRYRKFNHYFVSKFQQ